jgi:hypothetical protein
MKEMEKKITNAQGSDAQYLTIIANPKPFFTWVTQKFYSQETLLNL